VPQIIRIQRTQELVIAKARVRNLAHLVWQTFPEVLQAAGVSWKVYQDLAGQTFSPDFAARRSVCRRVRHARCRYRGVPPR
jgi:phospholipase C